MSETLNEVTRRRLDAWRAYALTQLGLPLDATLSNELTILLVALAEHRSPPVTAPERSLSHDQHGFFVVLEGERHTVHPPRDVDERVRLASQLLALPVARGGGNVAERLVSQWVPGSEVTLRDAMTAFAAGLVAGAEVKLELELEDGS